MAPKLNRKLSKKRTRKWSEIGQNKWHEIGQYMWEDAVNWSRGEFLHCSDGVGATGDFSSKIGLKMDSILVQKRFQIDQKRGAKNGQKMLEKMIKNWSKNVPKFDQKNA